MSDSPTLMIAGITGQLGVKIARAALDKGLNVRGVVRPGAERGSAKDKTVRMLRAEGVEFADGDLFDPDSLRMAAIGADYVVSAINGGEREMIEGQSNLLAAAKAANVKKFVPSDFSVDYFKLDLGDNDNLDYRIRFAKDVKESGVPHLFVLNGAFVEVQFSPAFQRFFDLDAKRMNYWGDGNQPCDFTTMDDTAEYLVEALLDADMVNRPLRIAGDVQSFNEMVKIMAAATGWLFTSKSLGTVEELKHAIGELKKTASSPWDYLPEQYHYCMVSGKGKLDPLDNGRYPRVSPKSIQAWFLGWWANISPVTAAEQAARR